MNSRHYLGVALSILSILVAFSNLEARPTIAVMDFIGKGVSDTEASALTDRLRSELVQTGKYKVVEREMMNAILAEQGFQMSGCTSDKCIVAAGQILGAAQMIAGSVSKVGKVYSVSARIVDVETGEITKVATYDHEGNIGELLRSGMKNVTATLVGEFRYARPQKTAKYRIVASGTLLWPREDPGGSGGWLSIEYSRELSQRVFFDLELGFGPEQWLVGEEVLWSDGTAYGHHYVEVGDKGLGVLMGRINYWLVGSNRIGVSSFAGFGLMLVGYTHGADYDTTHVSELKIHPFYPISSGLSLHLYQNMIISLRLDIGYLFSPTKLEKEFPISIANRPPNISISPSGMITSAKLRMYF